MLDLDFDPESIFDRKTYIGVSIDESIDAADDMVLNVAHGIVRWTQRQTTPAWSIALKICHLLAQKQAFQRPDSYSTQSVEKHQRWLFVEMQGHRWVGRWNGPSSLLWAKAFLCACRYLETGWWVVPRTHKG
jgi:hypothetical protein